MALRRSKRLKLEAESAQTSYDESVDTLPEKAKRKTKPKTVQTDLEFLSLNDYCLYAIFENLSLNDVCAVSQTCQRLYEVCVTHFQRCHKEKVLTIHNVRKNGNLEYHPKNEKYVNVFANNIQNVTLSKPFAVKANLKELSRIYKAQEVASIKELRFDSWGRGVRSTQSRLLANLVKDVESVTFSNTKVCGDLNECALQFMPKLKELTLWGKLIEPKDEPVNWMNHTYRKLERFSCHLEQNLPLVKIKHFLSINPNIKICSLRINSNSIEQLIQESIPIDELFVEIFHIIPSLDNLLVLCQQQPCRLHLKFNQTNIITLKRFLGKLESLAPYIEGLYFENSIDAELANLLLGFENLKVIQFTITSNADIVCRIPNLQEIYVFWGVNSSNFQQYRQAMMTFARRAPKLKKIYVRNNSQTFDKFKFNDMNAERRLLPGAEKLKIYIRTDELYYMGKLNDIERNYDLVEIVRVESENVKNPLIDEYLTTKQLNLRRY